jgi:hypothetical protein
MKTAVTKARLVTASSGITESEKYGFSSLDGNEESELLNNPKQGLLGVK